jgi:hypothetical protein
MSKDSRFAEVLPDIDQIRAEDKWILHGVLGSNLGIVEGVGPDYGQIAQLSDTRLTYQRTDADTVRGPIILRGSAGRSHTPLSAAFSALSR